MYLTCLQHAYYHYAPTEALFTTSEKVLILKEKYAIFNTQWSCSHKFALLVSRRKFPNS